MASIQHSTPDVDIYAFFLGKEQAVDTVIEKACREFQNVAIRSWHAVGDAVHLAPHVVRLSFDSAGNLSNRPDQRCNDLRLIRLELREFETTHNVEFVILPTSTRTSPPRIAVFDMDSTLIQAEVIDELASGVGKTSEVAAITNRAMNGEVDFAESLRLRVNLLRGVPTSIWNDMKARIKFMPGARGLTSALSRSGVKMAVFSGGFREMALWAGNELGIHRAAANQIGFCWADTTKLVSSGATDEFPYPHLTGELDPAAPIVTADKKKRLLLSFAGDLQVPLSQSICIGDGANDLQMLGASGSSGGIAIAFRAKASVQLDAPNRLNSRSLTDVLYLMGMDLHQIKNLSAEDGVGQLSNQVTKLMPD